VTEKEIYVKQRFQSLVFETMS